MFQLQPFEFGIDDGHHTWHEGDDGKSPFFTVAFPNTSNQGFDAPCIPEIAVSALPELFQSVGASTGVSLVADAY